MATRQLISNAATVQLHRHSMGGSIAMGTKIILVCRTLNQATDKNIALNDQTLAQRHIQQKSVVRSSIRTVFKAEKSFFR